MASVNSVTLIGNLGGDPEIRKTPGGASVCSFSIATTEKYNDKQGQRQEETEWHNITAWNKQADAMGQYLRKGSKVYIEGKLKTQSWEDNGVKKYRTEIVVKNFQFLDSKPEGQQQQGQGFGQPQQFSNQQQQQAPQQQMGGFGAQQPQQFGQQQNFQAPPQQNLPVGDELPF